MKLIKNVYNYLFLDYFNNYYNAVLLQYYMNIFLWFPLVFNS